MTERPSKNKKESIPRTSETYTLITHTNTPKCYLQLDSVVYPTRKESESDLTSSIKNYEE